MALDPIPVLRGDPVVLTVTMVKDGDPWTDVAAYAPVAQVRKRASSVVVVAEWDIDCAEDVMTMTLTVAAVEDLINFGTIMDFEVSETYFDSLVGVAPVGTRVTVYQVDAGDPMGLGIYEFAASSYTLVKDLFNGDYDGIFGYSTANVTDEAFTIGLSGFYSVNSLAGWPAERLTLASYFVRSEIPLSFTVPIKAEFDPDTGNGKDLVNKDAYDLLVARIELLEAEVFP